MKFSKLIWSFLPPILWISLIYFASSQPYEKQDIRPVLSDFDLEWVESYFSWVSFTYSSSVISIEAKGTAAFVEFFIRKGAHVFVFFVLGFLILRLMKVFYNRSFLQIFSSFFFIIVIAGIDEYRHYHNPGRTGLIEDVILDSVSGFIGICIASLFYKRS